MQCRLCHVLAADDSSLRLLKLQPGYVTAVPVHAAADLRLSSASVFAGSRLGGGLLDDVRCCSADTDPQTLVRQMREVTEHRRRQVSRLQRKSCLALQQGHVTVRFVGRR